MASLAGNLFDGFAYGMLLFVLAVGLSVTLGLMNFVNLAHGSFAMLGGYVAASLMQAGWPFLVTLPAAFGAAAGAGILLERTLFRRFYGASQLDQVLLTIGLVFVSVAGAAFIWGTKHQPVRLPAYLSGSTRLLGLEVGSYRVFVAGCGIVIAGALAFGLERTRFGTRVRAAVDHQRMARGLGIDVDRIFGATFALGSGLAGLGGALAIDIVGLDPTFALKVLVIVLIVVAVGGLGSILGAFIAATLLGIGDVAGKYYVPEIGAFVIYAMMVGLLVWRPAGLLGKRRA